MRLVTWNCRIGGFRKKAKHIAPLRPDVLAVQEVERFDGVPSFAGDCQPTFRDQLCNPQFPRRSIGVFSYTGVKLTRVREATPSMASGAIEHSAEICGSKSPRSGRRPRSRA